MSDFVQFNFGASDALSQACVVARLRVEAAAHAQRVAWENASRQWSGSARAAAASLIENQLRDLSALTEQLYQVARLVDHSASQAFEDRRRSEAAD